MRSLWDEFRLSPNERKNLAYTAKIVQRMIGRNRWLQLPEIARLFGLSEDSIKRLAKNHGLPLRRVSPLATPGALESELEDWLKGQPLVGPPVRSKRRIVRKRS
jgi:predicted DNA-binding transcriptional regulator AlpA